MGAISSPRRPSGGTAASSRTGPGPIEGPPRYSSRVWGPPVASFFLEFAPPPRIDAKGRVPLEWLVILGWNGIGLAMWWAASRHRARLAPGEQDRLIVGEH